MQQFFKKREEINITRQLAEIEKQLLIEEPLKVADSKVVCQRIKEKSAFKSVVEELNQKVKYVVMFKDKFPEPFKIFLEELQKNIFSESAEFSFDNLVDVRQQCDKMLSELLSAGSFPDRADFRVQKDSLEMVIEGTKKIAAQIREYLPPLESEVAVRPSSRI